MRPIDFFVLLLSSGAFALDDYNRREASTIPSDAQFSSAASQLISLYVPPSVASAIYSAATAASVSGSPDKIIESALTDTATPTWLAAVPSHYQSNIQSLDAALSSLRGEANAGTISGAPFVVTSINEYGSNVVTTVTPSPFTRSTPSGATIIGGVSGLSSASGSGATNVAGSSTGSASVSGSTVVAVGSTNVPSSTAASGLSIGCIICVVHDVKTCCTELTSPKTATSGSSAASASSGSSASSLTTLTGTSTQSSSPSSASSAAASSASSSSSASSGMACATQVPGMAMGVFGLLGAVVAL